MKLAKGEFEIMAKFIKQISGISLEKNKTYLIESRLSDLAQKESCKTFSDLFFKGQYNKALQAKIIDAISTNETSFFRDQSPFDALRYKIIPDIIDKKSTLKGTSNTIKVWSAACSSGQEPYSIGMVFMELLPDINVKWNVNVLATDIADDIINKASKGCFTEFEINRGLPQNLRNKYFKNKNGSWHINENIRKLITFKKINLMDISSGIGKFDIIFCRNVAIYFDIDLKRILFNRLADNLNDYGYLFIGSSETLIGVCEKFVSRSYLRTIVYQLK